MVKVYVQEYTNVLRDIQGYTVLWHYGIFCIRSTYVCTSWVQSVSAVSITCTDIKCMHLTQMKLQDPYCTVVNMCNSNMQTDVSHNMQTDMSHNMQTDVSHNMQTDVSHNMQTDMSHNMQTDVSHNMQTDVSHNMQTNVSHNMQTDVSHNMQTDMSHNMQTDVSHNMQTDTSHNMQTDASHNMQTDTSHNMQTDMNVIQTQIHTKIFFDIARFELRTLKVMGRAVLTSTGLFPFPYMEYSMP